VNSTESNVYAAPVAKKSRKRHAEEDAPTGVVGVREVVGAFAIGACFVALGMWQVKTVFAIRDYRMGTSDVIQETMARRDKSREMAVRIGSLQTAESMRQAAFTNFGMVDPEPAQVTRLRVSNDAVARWRAAAAEPTAKENRK